MKKAESTKTTKNTSSEIPINSRIKTVWIDFKYFLSDLISIRKGTDKTGTIEDIKGNISIKGHTAWVLVFSIVIASIGLNISSSAVVIGAMLISPLMGPILGVGLSIGTNDIDTLRLSLINLGVMIGLSLGTSFLFFSIPIFKGETPELLARTAPDIRDVFIAIAGGLALIVALSRRSEQMNIVAGVAIATALMPPLCTAGYGLAIWNLSYFGGAMFLFTINTIFIALATFVIVKYLKFPMVKYLNSRKRRRIARLASLIAFIVFTGSIYLFVNLFKENQFKRASNDLILDIKKSGINIIDEDGENLNFKENSVQIFVYGKRMSNDEIDKWTAKLPEYGLDKTKLIIQQGIDTDLRNEIKNLKKLFIQNQKTITIKDESLLKKRDSVKQLTHLLGTQVPFLQISKEAHVNYSGLKQFEFAKFIKTDFNSMDTVLVFNATWKKTDLKNIKDQQILLKKWLQTRLNDNTIELNNY